MASRVPLSPGPALGRAWVGVAALGLAGSLLCWWLPAVVLDWQPDMASTEPWRAITAAWVHWSPQHLAANAVGAVVVAALGWVAKLPARAALAWALAWPLTQAGLLLQPELAHYGGLSGVLHAGVAVAAVCLLRCGTDHRHRRVGAGIAMGLLVKLLIEAPWGTALRQSPELDIAVAPLAHASGALAGALCALAFGGRAQSREIKQ